MLDFVGGSCMFSLSCPIHVVEFLIHVLCFYKYLGISDGDNKPFGNNDDLKLLIQEIPTFHIFSSHRIANYAKFTI